MVITLDQVDRSNSMSYLASGLYHFKCLILNKRDITYQPENKDWSLKCSEVILLLFGKKIRCLSDNEA